jgi:UDP-GlcNAc:undecaprenyl-phosphate GlcNAc-1-phosphate transferase
MSLRLVLGFIFAFLSSLVFTFLVKNFCQKHNFALQRPRPRDLHKEPVPRLGGVALFLAFAFSALIFFRPQELPLKSLLALLLGAFLIVIIMAVDDIFGLSAWVKLVSQFLVAMLPVLLGVHLDFIRIPFYKYLNLLEKRVSFHLAGFSLEVIVWSAVVIVLWLVLLMNAVNFLDGLDGLATSICALAAFTICLLSFSKIVGQKDVGFLSFLLTGAALGFLPLNWYKAKIFLGDSGSMFLGYMLGLLSVIAGSKMATLGLVLGLAILDALLVVTTRILTGKNPFTQPGQDHLHHRLIKAGFSVPEAVSIYLVLSGLIGIAAIFAKTNQKGIMFVFLAVTLAALIYFLKNRKTRNHSKALEEN